MSVFFRTRPPIRLAPSRHPAPPQLPAPAPRPMTRDETRRWVGDLRRIGVSAFFVEHPDGSYGWSAVA